MDFDWSDENRRYRTRVRDFLQQELPSNWPEIARHGPGSHEQTRFSLEFCPKLAEAGFLTPHWPTGLGGSGASPWEHLILGEEMWACGEPRGGQYMNVNWIGPTLMRYGTPEQQARHLPQMSAGKAVWCQGFSEPNAGSDLASLRTRATRDGDDYIINGTKIWTSYASLAETCFLLVRTGPLSEGKAAIAILLIPMDTPGIEVRAIPSLVGHGDIHEVFFTDVRVPVTTRLGEEGQAWEIIGYSLANERVGIPRYAMSARVLEHMVADLKRQDRFNDGAIRMRAGEAAAACEAARMLVYKLVDMRARGIPVGADASLARVATVAADNAVLDFALDYLPEFMTGTEHPEYLAHHERAIVAGVASGAAEIQLNLIAQRHLDLPRGPR